MTTIQNIINEFQNLEGKEVGKGTYFHQMFTTNNLDTINILDVLENLKSYEIDNFEIMNYLDEYEEEILEVSFEEFCEAEEYEEIKSDNSYNWLSPVSNHFNYRIYQSNLWEGIIVEFKVHKYGDVRCNYTEEIYLRFNGEYEFYEVLSESSKYIKVDKNDKEYYITINIFSDCPIIEIESENYFEQIEGWEAYEIFEELLASNCKMEIL